MATQNTIVCIRTNLSILKISNFSNTGNVASTISQCAPVTVQRVIVLPAPVGCVRSQCIVIGTETAATLCVTFGGLRDGSHPDDWEKNRPVMHDGDRRVPILNVRYNQTVELENKLENERDMLLVAFSTRWVSCCLEVTFVRSCFWTWWLSFLRAGCQLYSHIFLHVTLTFSHQLSYMSCLNVTKSFDRTLALT